MSFLAKKDYFASLYEGQPLVITASDENRSAQTAQARNEKGDIVAEEVYGETAAPTCSYALSGDVDLTGIKIGFPFTTDDESLVVTGITINTAAGQAPTVDIAGEIIPDSLTGHTDCYYIVPSATIEKCHHAQDVLGAYTLVGTGCYVTQANYGVETSLTKATKDGETVSYDVSDGKVTCSLTIQGTGQTSAPTLTAKDGWKVTSPLTMSNPDAGYPTWTASLTKNLEHATLTAG